MWAIRILNGPQGGQTFPLKMGANTVGRGDHCDIVLRGGSISKEHARIEVSAAGIVLQDLGSSNGTFANGLKIKQHRVRPGDKFAFHAIVFDFIRAPQAVQPQSAAGVAGAFPPPNPGYAPAGPAPVSAPPANDLAYKVKRYIEEVLLPGVYHFAETLEFHWVLAVFMGIFVLGVTSLSTIPLVRTLKTGIQKESQNRAETIAKYLAERNTQNLANGNQAALSVQNAEEESGVESAFIIDSRDGAILSPATLAGKTSDIPFVHESRLNKLSGSKQVDDSTIIALQPIEFFNPETSQTSVAAYAVVKYRINSEAVITDGKTIAMFVQTLFISLLLGAVLFYFLFKTVTHPMAELNRQLDTALRERRDNIEVRFNEEHFQKLVTNVNSALTRALSAGDDVSKPKQTDYDRTGEYESLVQLIGFPAMIVKAIDATIASVNSAFEEKTGMNSNQLIFGSLENITDQALKLNVRALLEQSRQTPDRLASHPLELQGQRHDITVQAVFGHDAIAYFIVVILPAAEEGGHAA